MTVDEIKAKIKPGAVFYLNGNEYRIKDVEDGRAVIQEWRVVHSVTFGVDAMARIEGITWK